MIVSHTSIVSKKENVVYERGNLLCFELRKNDRIIDQYWKTKNPKESHPYTYESEGSRFYYWGAPTFLESDKCANVEGYFNEIPENPTFVDPETFSDFDDLLCIHLQYDGYIYRITDPTPVPLWTYVDYIGGICNDNFDLTEARKSLEQFDFVRNIHLGTIPHYSQESDRTKYLSFDYKLSRANTEKYLKLNISLDELFYTNSILNCDIFNLKDALLPKKDERSEL